MNCWTTLRDPWTPGSTGAAVTTQGDKGQIPTCPHCRAGGTCIYTCGFPLTQSVIQSLCRDFQWVVRGWIYAASPPQEEALLPSFSIPCQTTIKATGISPLLWAVSSPTRADSGFWRYFPHVATKQQVFLGGTRLKTCSTTQAQGETFLYPACKAMRTVQTPEPWTTAPPARLWWFSLQISIICPKIQASFRKGEQGGEPAVQWFILPRNRGPSLEYCDTW